MENWVENCGIAVGLLWFDLFNERQFGGQFRRFEVSEDVDICSSNYFSS